MTSKVSCLLLAIMLPFAFTACGGGGGDSTGGNDSSGSTFSVEGSFTKGNQDGMGSEEVKFKLADSASYSKAVSSASYAIAGELEDGDVTFRLKGTYDPEARSYSVSAAGSTLRYNISGAFDASGASLGSTATLSVKSGDDWPSYTFPVTESTVTLADRTVTESTGGIPSQLLGWWHVSEKYDDGSRLNGSVVVSPFSLKVSYTATYTDGQTKHDEYQSTVVDVEGSGNIYNIVFAYPVYEPSGKDQVAEAISAYLNGKVAATRVTSGSDVEPGFSGAGAQYYITSTFDVYWYGFSDWNVVGAYYDTNALTKYLISQSVSPATKYEKNKFVVSGNSITVTAYGTPVGDYYRTECDSVTAAKALTELDTESAYTVTR